MTGRAAKLFAVLAIAGAASLGLGGEVFAKCTNKCQTGWNSCNSWCADHNKTTNSLNKCLFKCAAYWDSGRNPQSLTIDPGNPGKPYSPVTATHPVGNKP